MDREEKLMAFCSMCGEDVGNLMSMHYFVCKVMAEECKEIEERSSANESSEEVKQPVRRKKMHHIATELEWLRWLRRNAAPHERVLEVLKADFERETKKVCPENL